MGRCLGGDSDRGQLEDSSRAETEGWGHEGRGPSSRTLTKSEGWVVAKVLGLLSWMKRRGCGWL